MTTPTQPPPESGSAKGSPFTRKLGPLPLWAWMGVGLAVVLVYANWQKNKSGSTSTGLGSSTGSTSVNSPGGVDASLVPQFVNQTFTNTTPSPAPSVTVNNTVPAPTTMPAPTTNAPPTTVSSAPGSYTTSLNTGYDEWTSTGQYSLNTVAASHGMTAQQLLASSESQENNQGMIAYAKAGNYNAPIPSGVHLYIPAANWAMKK